MNEDKYNEGNGKEDVFASVFIAIKDDRLMKMEPFAQNKYKKERKARKKMSERHHRNGVKKANGWQRGKRNKGWVSGPGDWPRR